MNNRLRRGATSLGICLVTTGLVIWIRGGFDSALQRTGPWQQPWLPPSGQPPGHPPGPAGHKPTASARTAAIQLMLQGKTGAFSLPGAMCPPTVSAESAVLQEDEQVVGVEINGTCRAYSLWQMRMPWTHVINDVVGGVPVTVTYCDRTDCVRVFTGEDESPRPLNVGVGGFADGKMLLHVQQRNFSQDSHEIPLAEMEFERTTWKPWKIAHPKTDVCTDAAENRADPKPEAGNGDGLPTPPIAIPATAPSDSQ